MIVLIICNYNDRNTGLLRHDGRRLRGRERLHLRDGQGRRRHQRGRTPTVHVRTGRRDPVPSGRRRRRRVRRPGDDQRGNTAVPVHEKQKLVDGESTNISWR